MTESRGEIAGDGVVAIEGIRGTFAHAAALRVFGDDVAVRECRTVREVLTVVAEGGSEYGAVSVENSISGAVQPTLDPIVELGLSAVAEATIHFRPCLVAERGTAPSSIRRIATHPAALRQCQRFFSSRRELVPVPTFSSAESVRDLATTTEYDAAIGSELAAKMYDAEVIDRGIGDDTRSYNRFLIVAKNPATPALATPKTSVIFDVQHVPGALYTALSVLQLYDIDLTRIASRPLDGRPWRYRFFADLQGGTAESQLAAVRALKAVAAEVRVLGQYEAESAGTEADSLSA